MRNREKLDANMSIAQMMWVMSEGNPGAMSVLGQMLNDASSVDNIAGGLVDAIMRILLLDGMGVRGSSIWILWKDCSREDMNIFKATLRILQCGSLDLESEIDFNIGDRNLSCAVPYVDPELMVDGHKSADLIAEGIGPTHPLFDEFCKVQVANFRTNLAARVKALEESQTLLEQCLASRTPRNDI